VTVFRSPRPRAGQNVYAPLMPQTSPSLPRKEFLGLAALGALGFAAGCATTGRRPVPRDGVLRHAAIGAGGIGSTDLDQLRTHPRLRVTALCDTDATLLAAAQRKFPDARAYTDWRELFAREGEALETCNVSIPDHMHAVVALAAIRRGISVYCQKPMAHDVTECRALTLAAAATGVTTQLGTQHAAGPGDRLAVHLLRSGVIGKARRAYLCSNRSTAARYRLAGPRPAGGVPPPESLAWDLWLGNAPARPYAPGLYHSTTWRSWQDFGTGWSGDIGCHIFDAVWKGLGLTAPRTVTAEVQASWRTTPARRGDTWPQGNHLTWKFPGNAATEGPDFTAEWFDGEFFPPAEAQAIARDLGFVKYPEEASLVIGTEGALLLPHTSGPRLHPAPKFADLTRPNLTGPSHYHGFIDACLNRTPADSDFARSGPMAEAVILGTVAIRQPGDVLQWDSGRLRVLNSAAANRLLRRTYRSGWELDLKV